MSIGDRRRTTRQQRRIKVSVEMKVNDEDEGQ